jgi:V/A-type H+-transporting ATPase subunit I
VIRSMSFVEIAGVREDFDRAVDALQRAGVMHIEDVPFASDEDASPIRRARLSESQEQEKGLCEEVVDLLDREVINHLSAGVIERICASDEYRQLYRECSLLATGAVVASARTLHAEVRSLARRRRNIDDDLQVLKAYEESAAALAPLIESRGFPQDYEMLGLLFERNERRARSLLRERLSKLTGGRYRIHEVPLKKGRTAALVGFDRDAGSAARKFIRDAGLSEMRGPRYLRGKPFEEMLAAVERDLADLIKQRDLIDEQDRRYFGQKAARLLAVLAVCRDRRDRLQAVTRFARTRYSFIMHGWIPSVHIRQLRDQMTAACTKSVMLSVLRTRLAPNVAPVQLFNSPPLRPFEKLLALMPLPRYGTIDPTSLVAVFFPPMFGLMLGDIGYGMLLALGAGALRYWGRAREIPRALSAVMAWCAIYAVGFGFVFGEFFGTIGHQLGLRPLWQERLSLTAADKSEGIFGYMFLALAVGAAQILLGLVLGIFNARKERDGATILNSVAKIAGLFGLFFILGRLVNFLPSGFLSVGVVVLLLFFVLFGFSARHQGIHGLLLPLELLSTVGNILSYARIMAVGIASVMLALLANHFGGTIGNTLLAIVVMVLIHALNLALGIIDPTIQGLRLQYVEFFSKFYITGGRSYLPFRTAGGTL